MQCMEFRSAPLARQHADRVARTKLREGYKRVAERRPRTGTRKPSALARDRDLVRAIVRDPDVDDHDLVYADWLQAQGDPRGEIAVLQHRGTSARRLRAKAAAPLATHVELLLGGFATGVLPEVGETLDLHGGILGDRGLAAMAKARRKFAHLSVLDLSDNALTLETAKPLAKTLAKRVELGWRQDRMRAARARG